MGYTAILILNYNNYEDTINCINSIENYNSSQIKYVVVDNASPRKDAVYCLDKYFSKKFGSEYKQYDVNSEVNYPLSKLSFFVCEKNKGYAEGNNKGLELVYQDSDIEYVMILNNDVLFVEDIISRLKDKMNLLPNCGIISPLLYKKGLVDLDYNCARLNCSIKDIILTYFFWYRDCFGCLTRIRERRLLLINQNLADLGDCIQIELPSGSCMLAKKTTFEQIGGFDSNTFLYYEENILFKKIRNIGKENYLLLTTKCIHLGASSTSQSDSASILKIGLDSATYYLRAYCHLSMFQKICVNIARFSFLIKLKLLQNKRNRNMRPRMTSCRE